MYPLKVEELLDVSASLIVVLDSDGTIVLINNKGCEVLGYERPEIEGRNWFYCFVPREQSDEKLRQFKLAMQAGEGFEFRQSYVVTRTGELRLINWKKTYLKDDSDNVVAMLRYGEDITEKKVLQDMLASKEKEKRIQMIAAALDAQEKERFYIASELHDNVGQILTTCKLLLEGEMQKENASQSLNYTYAHLQQAIDEIRNISHRLNPAQLNEIGLVNALEELIKKVNMTGKISASLIIEKERPFVKLEPGISLTIFRIVQEQLNNIMKHADAKEISITLSHSNDALELEVIDDGRGFTASKSPSKGLGLKNIYNRAELYNGKVVIQSSPGEGCTLSVFIPLQAS